MAIRSSCTGTEPKSSLWQTRPLRLFTVAVLGAAVIGALGPALVDAAEQEGTFRGRGVGFEVKYYAGGVGYSPREEAAEKSAEYSVRVFFATPEGALLGNAGLVVTDAQGRVVFRIEGADPVIYLGLPAGTYLLEGRYHSAAQRLRSAVDPARRRDIVFAFEE